MTTLRSKIIRLAHANPALRPHLLPLLKQTGTRIASNIERVFRSTKPFQSFKPMAQRVAYKPSGIWYSCGSDWDDWCKSEMPGWIKDAPFVYRLEVNLARMRVIRTEQDLVDFDAEYRHTDDLGDTRIDWPRVAQNYDGIEICPYQAKFRREFNWYYPWDVASGCIWGAGAFKSVEPVTSCGVSQGATPSPRVPEYLRSNPTLQQVRGLPEGIEIWTYEGSGPRGTYLAAIAFAGKSRKPLWDYSFRNEADRQRQIDMTVKSFSDSMKLKQEQQQARREFQHGFQVGDILSGSWGYEQINVNFYEVVGLPSIKQVNLREVAKRVVRQDIDIDYVVPVLGKYEGPVLRKSPTPDGVKIDRHLTVSKWDGKPQRQTS